MAEFEPAVEYVLAWEKGLEENPNDPGGITNYGISLRFLKSLPDLKPYGLDASTIDADDIRQLTIPNAKLIFYNEFWCKSNFKDLTIQGVANFVFDTAVNSGIAPAVKILQRAYMSVKMQYMEGFDDGILGSTTINVINNTFSGTLLSAMRSERAGYDRSIAIIHPTEAEFLHGWLNRSYQTKG